MKGGDLMIPKNYAECPVCGKNRIRINRGYVYAYIRCDNCKSEGWENEWPALFGKKEEQQKKEPLKAAESKPYQEYTNHSERRQAYDAR